MNPADLLAVARACALVPVVVLAPAAPEWAVAIFLVAAATDAVDGPLARRRGETSAFGAFLDPLADKVLVAGTLVALAVQGSAPAWAAAVVGAREVAVTLTRARGAVLAPGLLAKSKTGAQVCAVAALLAGWPADGLLLVAVALTVVSAAAYALPPSPRRWARAR